MAFEIKLDVTITKDGNPFFAQDNTWSNVSYEQMNAMEKFLVSVLEELTKKGEPGGEWGPAATKK